MSGFKGRSKDKPLNLPEEEGLALNRERMVADQIERRGITDKRLLGAMREVKRHLFVPAHLKKDAYEDGPLPIGMNQTISQPYIVALMTQLLNLQGHERVLEVGTGSGYQAAVLAELAKEVYTLEALGHLAGNAARLLKELGYSNISVRHGDGFSGWQEFSPFDSIIVTCAPCEIPQILTDQLIDGGRLVIPVGSFHQELKLIEKKGKELSAKDIIPVRFVPMLRKRPDD